MSLQHHGSPEEQLAIQRRFLEQITGTAKRDYPAGRMGADDDGTLSYAIANDDRHRVIVIRFGKAVEWIGLGVEDAERLRDELTERIMAMKGTIEKARTA